MSSSNDKKRICIIGSGNWGSVVSKIVGTNVQKFDKFEKQINMYVYEEEINGRKLTEIINNDHENVKYLPGHKLPENIIAVPNVEDTVKNADILLFVIPHQFLLRLCATMAGLVKPTAFAVSFIKGFSRIEGGGIELLSKVVTRTLNIPCYVLMGANLATEIAEEKFSETTLGCRDREKGSILKELIETDYFKVSVVSDEEAVEICGALKNIVACAAGFVDGLGYGDNTKAAVIRLGLMEMIKYVDLFYPGSKLATFFESCGIADLITSCYGGRNRRVSEELIKSGKPLVELEKTMLNGQKLQGPITSEEVNYMLKAKNLENEFPIFTAVYKVCTSEMSGPEFMECVKHSHSEHM